MMEIPFCRQFRRIPLARERNSPLNLIKYMLRLLTSSSRYSDEETCGWSDYDIGRVKGGLLLDSMGLGKSLSIISLIATDWPRSTAQVSGGKATILVAPSSLVRTWEGELIQHVRPNTLRWKVYHGPNRFKDIQDTLRCDLVITTYNVLATEWRDPSRTAKPLFSTPWHRIVLDEGRLKNHVIPLR